MLSNLVKSSKNDVFNLDKKTKDSIKKGVKVEVIPEIRDQFLAAVKDKIENSAQSVEDNVQSQVPAKVLNLK